MALSDNIKKLREEHNLTQQQLAQTLQKKILDFIQIVGAVFLAITTLLRVQLKMSVPIWCTILCLIIVAIAFLCNFLVSKKLRDM